MLAQFVHSGMDSGTVAVIGHLPEGKGLLGQLIHDPQPLRLRDLADHESSVGFPPGHPPMKSFLGAPVRIREQVFGNLYLTEKIDGHEFTKEDEGSSSHWPLPRPPPWRTRDCSRRSPNVSTGSTRPGA